MTAFYWGYGGVAQLACAESPSLWIGGLVALALFVYLVFAMLKPEWLS